MCSTSMLLPRGTRVKFKVDVQQSKSLDPLNLTGVVTARKGVTGMIVQQQSHSLQCVVQLDEPSVGLRPSDSVIRFDTEQEMMRFVEVIASDIRIVWEGGKFVRKSGQ